MKKMICALLFISVVYADDIYELTYSHEHNCTLLKNGKSIELFDKRFDKKQPKTSYTCSAIQKEQYTNCVIEDKNNITALVFSYGQYEYTNLLIAFKSPTKHIKSSVKVNCTKHIKPKK